jgi:hypothetical protein
MMMHFSRLLLSLSVVAVSACVFPFGGGDLGDVRVSWTFGGDALCARTGVEQVVVQLIPNDEGGRGQGQAVACSAGNVLLVDVVAGNYTAVLTGVGPAANYSNAPGVPLKVVGGQESPVTIDATSIAGRPRVPVSFIPTFGGRSCEQAGVTTIEASLLRADGTVAAGGGTAVACTVGSVSFAAVEPGTYELAVRAIDAVGGERFAASFPDTIISDTTTDLGARELVAVTSAVLVRWTLPNAQRCSVLGIDTINIQGLDGAGVSRGVTAACVTGEATLLVSPGALDIVVDGLGQGERLLVGTINQTVPAGTSTIVIALEPAPPDNGVVVARVTFSGSSSCAEAGVATLSGQLQGIDGLVPSGGSVTVACLDGNLRFEGVPIGVYNLIVTGESAAGEPLFVSLPTEVNLDEAVEDVGAVDLAGIVAVARIRFTFPGSERCADVGVQTVNVELRSGVNGSTGVRGTSVDCVLGEAVLLATPGLTTIALDGLEENLVTFGGVLADRILPVGESVIEVALTPRVSRLELDWDFALVEAEAGGAPVARSTTSCAIAGADAVNVRVLQGGVLVGASTNDCAGGIALLGGLPLGVIAIEVEGTLDGTIAYFTQTTATLSAARQRQQVRLQPAVSFARVIWGECATAATVNVQVNAGGFLVGTNATCAVGEVLLRLAPGAELGTGVVGIRPVDGQGNPFGATTTQTSALILGVNTFRFSAGL